MVSLITLKDRTESQNHRTIIGRWGWSRAVGKYCGIRGKVSKFVVVVMVKAALELAANK